MFQTVVFLAQISSCVMMSKVLMSRYPHLEERNITSSIISLTTGPQPEQSKSNCAELCTHVLDCASFFFNSLTNQCQFHGDLFMTDNRAIVQPGMQYYYKMKGRSGWCPTEKGFQLLDYNGPCVKFHTDLKTCDDAKQACEFYSPYSHLVILDNQEKNELVKAAGIATNDQFEKSVLIGLFDAGDNIYRWVDGREANFTDWEPNFDISVAGNYKAVSLHRQQGWLWLRNTCRSKYHYICEIEVELQLYHKMMNIFD